MTAEREQGGRGTVDSVLRALSLADGALERCYDELDPRDWSGRPEVRVQVKAAFDAVRTALPIAQGMSVEPWPTWPGPYSLQISRVVLELTQALGKYPRTAEGNDHLRLTVARAIGALSRIQREIRI